MKYSNINTYLSLIKEGNEGTGRGWRIFALEVLGESLSGE
jgi:hypothetical protein